MFSRKSIKKSLKARGYKHCSRDDAFSQHGDYARHLQYVYSKEFVGPDIKIVDLIFLSADFYEERIVIGFVRENVAIEDGVVQNSTVGIPLAKYSMDEFEKQLDRIIPKGDPLRRAAVAARQEF